MLKARLGRDAFLNYFCLQLDHFFPDGRTPGPEDIAQAADQAFAWYFACCGDLTRKYFRDGDDTLLSHTNTDQYAMLLYMMSHKLYLAGDLALAEKFYALNKALHAIDVFYSVKLPTRFMFSHCIGSVLGHATYGEYLRVGQNCTVGTEGGQQPVLGEGVALYKGSLVSGDSIIGDNVHVSAHCFVRRARVPDGVVVFQGRDGLEFKAANLTVKERFFYSGHSGGGEGEWHPILQ